MTRNPIAAAVFVCALAGAGDAFARDARLACEAPAALPGVRDPHAVSMFMTGSPGPDGGLRIGRVSFPNYKDIARRPTTVTLAAFQRDRALVRSIEGRERTLGVQYVSADYFDVLAAPLQLGRTFGTADAVDTPHAAIISDALWASMFGRAPGVLGQTLIVNGQGVPITGVAPPGFAGVQSASDETIWLPGPSYSALTGMPGLRAEDRASGGYYQFVARLAPGATWAQAHAELASLTEWLLERYPAENGKFIDVAFHDYGPIGCLARP